MNSIEYWQERCDQAENLAETLKDAAVCNAQEVREAKRACVELLSVARMALSRLPPEDWQVNPIKQAIQRAEELLGVKFEEDQEEQHEHDNEEIPGSEPDRVDPGHA